MNWVKQLYDEHYAARSDEFSLSYALSNVDSTVVKALKYRPKGRILDVGAGSGSESLFLARLGFMVDAIDISEVAVQKLQQVAKEHHLPLVAHVTDILSASIPTHYQAIICGYVLQYFSRETAKALLTKIQSATAPGGLHILRVHGDSDYGRYRTQMESWVIYNEAQLRSYYAGWDILEFENDKGVISFNGYSLEYNSLAMIARKR